GAFDDLAFFAEVASADAGFEERGEAVGHGRALLRCFACGAQGCGLSRHWVWQILDGPPCAGGARVVDVGWGEASLQRTDQSSQLAPKARNSLRDPFCQRGFNGAWPRQRKTMPNR